MLWFLVPWCSGPTCVPVKDETASSNLVGTAARVALPYRESKDAGLVLTGLLDCPLSRRPGRASRAYLTPLIDLRVSGIARYRAGSVLGCAETAPNFTVRRESVWVGR